MRIILSLAVAGQPVTRSRIIGTLQNVNLWIFFPFCSLARPRNLLRINMLRLLVSLFWKKNYELERKIDKLNGEKRAFEYFKRVLMDEQNNVIDKAFTKNGRFGLVVSVVKEGHLGLDVYLEEEDWDGERKPRPACCLDYFVSEDGFKISYLESDPKSPGGLPNRNTIELSPILVPNFYKPFTIFYSAQSPGSISFGRFGTV